MNVDAAAIAEVLGGPAVFGRPITSIRGLALDEDVADFLKAQSRLQDKPFKQVVNEVLRRGMASGAHGPEPPEFQVVPNRSGLVPGVDPLRLNQLNDQLEADDFTAESGQ